MSAALAAVDPVDIDLVVRSIPRDTLHAGEPFCVACTLGVSASVREGQQRTLSLAVQHVQSAVPTTPPESAPPVSSTTTAAATTARLASAVAVAMGSSPTARAPLTLLDGPMVGSPRATQPAEQEEDDPASGQRIPPPEPLPGDEARYNKLQGASRFLGASTLLVPPMTLVRTHPESSSYSSATTTMAEVQQQARKCGFGTLSSSTPHSGPGSCRSVGCGSCFWRIDCTVQRKHIYKGDPVLPWY
jgi:hypothetical protein